MLTKNGLRFKSNHMKNSGSDILQYIITLNWEIFSRGFFHNVVLNIRNDASYTSWNFTFSFIWQIFRFTLTNKFTWKYHFSLCLSLFYILQEIASEETYIFLKERCFWKGNFILTLSWRRPISYRNQSIDLSWKG